MQAPTAIGTTVITATWSTDDVASDRPVSGTMSCGSSGTAITARMPYRYSGASIQRACGFARANRVAQMVAVTSMTAAPAPCCAHAPAAARPGRFAAASTPPGLLAGSKRYSGTCMTSETPYPASTVTRAVVVRRVPDGNARSRCTRRARTAVASTVAMAPNTAIGRFARPAASSRAAPTTMIAPVRLAGRRAHASHPIAAKTSALSGMAVACHQDASV